MTFPGFPCRSQMKYFLSTSLQYNHKLALCSGSFFLIVVNFSEENWFFGENQYIYRYIIYQLQNSLVYPNTRQWIFSKFSELCKHVTFSIYTTLEKLSGFTNHPLFHITILINSLFAFWMSTFFSSEYFILMKCWCFNT